MLKWTPTTNDLAQGLHLSLGALATAIPFVLGGPHWIGAAAILAFAVVKEFTFDLRVEGATVANGFLDLSFYVYGVAAMYLLIRVMR